MVWQGSDERFLALFSVEMNPRIITSVYDFGDGNAIWQCVFSLITVCGKMQIF